MTNKIIQTSVADADLLSKKKKNFKRVPLIYLFLFFHWQKCGKTRKHPTPSLRPVFKFHKSSL